MSRVGGLGPIKPERQPPKLPESDDAYQIPSKGGLLPSQETHFFINFLISIRTWFTAKFIPLEDPSSTRRNNIFKLFDAAQNLLAGRIPKQQEKEIKNWLLTEASPKWLANFATFLNEATRLESLKPKQYLIGTTPETQLLMKLGADATMALTENKLRAIRSLLTEIIYVTIVTNTQVIDYTIKPSASTRAYLFSGIKDMPFSLQFEMRSEERALYITDPQTKETRRVVFPPKDVDEEKEQRLEEVRHRQFAEAIYSLSHSEIIDKTLSEEEIKNWIKKGDIYDIPFGSDKRLTLCPRLSDIYRTGFPDKNPIVNVSKLIAQGKENEIIKLIIPIDTLKAEEIEVRVRSTATVDRKFREVTYTYKSFIYTTTYPLRKQETLSDLSRRITEDHTIERDLLLARSYFARHKT